MSPRLVAATLLLIVPALLNAATSIVRVWPAYRDADSFRRISEYIGGRESTGGEIVLRTQADSRDGYYFLTRLKNDSATPSATLVLEVVLPGTPAVHSFSFVTDLPAGHQVYQLGVTGADWPGKATRPSAWRVTVRSSDGTILAERTSFLWTAPAATAAATK